MESIKELSEAIVGVNEVGIELIKQFKDGVQFSDFEAFYMAFTQNLDFKNKVLAAYEGLSKVPAEIKDLDLTEGIQLLMLQSSYVPRIVEALKKPVPVA